jgi:hypothetical protein
MKILKIFLILFGACSRLIPLEIKSVLTEK